MAVFLPASTPALMRWTYLHLSRSCVLHQVWPLRKQLRWTHFFCRRRKPRRASRLLFSLCRDAPLAHPQSSAPTYMKGSGVPGFFFFLLWCPRERTNAGWGHLCTRTGKTCYRREYCGSAPSDYTTTSDVHQTEYLLRLLVWVEKEGEKVSA